MENSIRNARSERFSRRSRTNARRLLGEGPHLNTGRGLHSNCSRVPIGFAWARCLPGSNLSARSASAGSTQIPICFLPLGTGRGLRAKFGRSGSNGSHSGTRGALATRRAEVEVDASSRLTILASLIDAKSIKVNQKKNEVGLRPAAIRSVQSACLPSLPPLSINGARITEPTAPKPSAAWSNSG
jgi:hypothetical protein